MGAQALLVTSGACSVTRMNTPTPPKLNPAASPAAHRWARLIWRRRREAGLSQSQLADLVNVPQQTVSAWERAEYEPNLATQARIVNALSIPAGDLVGLFEEPV